MLRLQYPLSTIQPRLIVLQMIYYQTFSIYTEIIPSIIRHSVYAKITQIIYAQITSFADDRSMLRLDQIIYHQIFTLCLNYACYYKYPVCAQITSNNLLSSIHSPLKLHYLLQISNYIIYYRYTVSDQITLSIIDIHSSLRSHYLL